MTKLEQDELNATSIENPRVGDSWWERVFCLYFVVVNVNEDGTYTILSGIDLGDVKSAKVEDRHDNTYTLDFSKHHVVSKEWMSKVVHYSSGDGYVAHVINTTNTQAIANEWREFHTNRLLSELEKLTKKGKS